MISTYTSSKNGCFDHLPYATVVSVQDGWNAIGGRNMITISDPMAKECQYRHTELGKADERCTGCKWRDAGDAP